MNSPFLLVLFVYLFIKGIENIVTLVNLSHLNRYGHKVPAGFDGFVDNATLSRMRDYTVDHNRVDFFSAGLDVLITVVFIFGGFLDLYNSWLFGQGWSNTVSGICFFLFLSWGGLILQIPFDLYKTFVLEEKYGFNRQTFALWLADAAKGLFLTTLISAFMLWVAFRLMAWLPGFWWLLLWAFMLLFKLFMLYVSPYVIEPLFNKFTPINDKKLEEKIRELFIKAGLSVSRVFTMDASKRSGHGNAYFSGIGHVKRIVLFDTLLAKNSEDEILAILAHEAGHWKKKHILKRLVVMEVVSLVGLYLVWWFMQNNLLTDVFHIKEPTLYVKLLLVGFCGMLAAFPFKPLFSYFSRKHEWEADAFAVELSGKSKALAQALVKLGRDNLANLHPHPWQIALHYSHPPLPQRVKKLLGE
ncbi:MAG: M48 family metallopeptidase [Pseudomonadota bacterium]